MRPWTSAPPGLAGARLASVLGLLLGLWIRLSPVTAAHLAAHITGQPKPDAAGHRLAAICHRESRCTAMGVHVLGAYVSEPEYHGQVRLGHLDPTCQGNTPVGRWGPRGAWGLSAASHWRYLPACYQPEILDQTLVSAIVAARKWKARCVDAAGYLLPDRPPWCRAHVRWPTPG